MEHPEPKESQEDTAGFPRKQLVGARKNFIDFSVHTKTLVLSFRKKIKKII